MYHDEKRFPEPETFDPAHFLNDDGTLNQDIPCPTESGAFGFGRRICPGRHLACGSMWIGIASVLSTFDLQKPLSPDGRVIEPEGGHTSGLVS